MNSSSNNLFSVLVFLVMLALLVNSATTQPPDQARLLRVHNNITLTDKLLIICRDVRLPLTLASHEEVFLVLEVGVKEFECTANWEDPKSRKKYSMNFANLNKGWEARYCDYGRCMLYYSDDGLFVFYENNASFAPIATWNQTK
ncbi:hypothetical protein Sjap_007795 [Stephania japonica]|uniref:S-protein homolog n=1 Tax=Stephania japonica TaxID=461633 RepID=A0AAP0PDV9_9MAGN